MKNGMNNIRKALELLKNIYGDGCLYRLDIKFLLKNIPKSVLSERDRSCLNTVFESRVIEHFRSGSDFPTVFNELRDFSGWETEVVLYILKPFAEVLSITIPNDFLEEIWDEIAQRTDGTVSSTADINNHLVLINGGGTITPNGKVFNVEKFYCCNHMVTQKEYEEIMGENPSAIKGDSLPVVDVSWYDAILFCNKLSIKENLKPYYNFMVENTTVNKEANGYRLLSLAEYIFLWNAGKYTGTCRFPGSNNPQNVGWFCSIEDCEVREDEDESCIDDCPEDKTLKSVCTKYPNELGIYDLFGNAWEWVFDSTVDNTENRFSVGGSFCGYVPSNATIENFISFDNAGAKYYNQGFRIARNG